MLSNVEFGCGLGLLLLGLGLIMEGLSQEQQAGGLPTCP